METTFPATGTPTERVAVVTATGTVEIGSFVMEIGSIAGGSAPVFSTSETAGVTVLAIDVLETPESTGVPVVCVAVCSGSETAGVLVASAVDAKSPATAVSSDFARVLI